MLCEAADAKIEGNSARLTCLADENGPDPMPVTLQEDRSAGTLAYTDADGTLTLRRSRELTFRPQGVVPGEGVRRDDRVCKPRRRGASTRPTRR